MPPYLIEKIISRRKRCDKKARANYCGVGSYFYTNFGTHGVSCGISPLAHTSSRNSAELLCRFIYNLNRSYFAKVAIVYKNASAFALA